MSISCIVQEDNTDLERCAKALNKSKSLTSIYISKWQTKNKTVEYPTSKQIKDFYKKERAYKNNLNLNHNSDYARLNMTYNPVMRQDRAIKIAKVFSEVLNTVVNEVMNDLDSQIAEATGGERDILINRRKEYAGENGRKAILRDFGINSMIERVKQEFQSYIKVPEADYDADYGEGKGRYMIDEYQKVLDNFQALFDEACIWIENEEDVRIVTTHQNQETTAEVTETTTTQEMDEDGIEEENEDKASGNDGWGFEVRMVDPYSTLSKDTKRVLSHIAKYTNKGMPDVDDMGEIRFLNPAYTHACLITELSSMITPDDFSVVSGDEITFPALEKMATKYPWVRQVINKLKVDEKLRGSFYADLRNDLISYYGEIMDKDNALKTVPLNEVPAKQSMFTSIQNNYYERNILDKDSIYTKTGKVDSSKAEIGVRLTSGLTLQLREVDSSNKGDIAKTLLKVLNMAGIDMEETILNNMLDTPEGISSIAKVNTTLKGIFSGITDVSEDTDIIEQFKESYNIISSELAMLNEFDIVLSFRDNDKTMYSLSKPNYVDTIIKIFKDDNKRDTFIQKEFKDYKWFFNPKTGKWRSKWLELLENDPIVRNHLSTREVINITRTQGNSKDYKHWEPSDIRVGFINEYFSEPANTKSQIQFAWYNMPIFSDSPVVKFIRMPKYTGDFKGQIIPLLREIVMQEIYRIDLVRKRHDAGVTPIQNFDLKIDDRTTDLKNGNKFHFFPELNDGTFLEEALRLTKDKNTNDLVKLIDTNLNTIMNKLFAEFMYNSKNELDEIMNNLVRNNIAKPGDNIVNILEEYFWNQAYATTQIIELTTTDLAFYKDEVDFQKRYKEVYASGTKLNTNTKYGKKIRRTLYLEDQEILSPSFIDIRKSLDKAVASKRLSKMDRDNIINKFKNVVVTDAQAYVSPAAMRSILDMAGKWTDEMEAAYNRFENNEWDIADFNIIWQTIKPFVFTQLRKPDGVEGFMKVPHQNKNSEYLLLAAYSMVAGETGASPKLKALQRYMEDNDIDAVQFATAVKAGGQGIIDINYSESKLKKVLTPDILDKAKQVLGKKFDTASDIEKFKAAYNALLEHGNITQTRYNNVMASIEPDEDQIYKTIDSQAKENGNFKPEALHEIPYDDYMIQQPVPEHLIDTEGIFGSQIRNLILADLDAETINIQGKDITRQQAIDLYNACIVENLMDSYKNIKKDFADIYSLQQLLLSQIKGNSRYGRDMINALEIVEIINPLTGMKEEVFNMPFSNPTITLELQKLLTSVFKNNIAKQYIKGGNAVQVSDFGLTDALKIKYDKQGNLIGFECFLPATSKVFFESFMITKINEKGEEYQILDINALKKAGLDRAVGFRIPTEDKYSMAPLIIKGFLPQQNGSCIMLPAEITTIAGSDFDIDKMFIMLPEFQVYTHDMQKARYYYSRENAKFKEILSKLKVDQLLEDVLEIEGEDAFQEWFKENKKRFEYDAPVIKKIKYDMNKKPESNSRKQRNNMLIDIIYSILVHPTTADKLFNLGNFDGVKIQADIAQVIKNKQLLNAFKKKYNLKEQKDVIKKILEISGNNNLDEIEDFMKEYKKKHNMTRSQLTLDTFIYNHTQNMTGKGLVGIYANNTSMQAKYQYSNLAIMDGLDFNLNGREIKSLHDEISGLGERISKNCAQFSAASVDNVKYPALDKIMQNTNTAKVAGFMLRAGFSIEEIGLFFSQPLIVYCIETTGGLDGLEKMVEDLGDELFKDGGFQVYSEIPDLTSELLLESVLNNVDTNEHNISIATEHYRKGLPQQNPNTAYVFTDNAEAYSYANGINVSKNYNIEFPYKHAPKINVSDVGGTNQAGIRTDAKGNISKNAFGIVVKKYQQNAEGGFVTKEGQFQDTDADFELFKDLNNDMFERLATSDLNNIIFPEEMATGRAALPMRFVQWLQYELANRFNISSSIQKNTRSDYEGYGLKLENIQNQIPQQSNDDILKMGALELKIANTMCNIVLLANYLSEITQVSRADSPNGGILNTIGGAKVQLVKVEELDRKARMGESPFTGTEGLIHNNIVTIDTSESELRKTLLNSNMSKLQAFHSLGIEFGIATIAKFFPQVNAVSDGILREAVTNLRPSDMLRTTYMTGLFNDIYKDVVNFALSDTDIFGNDGKRTFFEKRKYYLEQFPKDFVSLKATHPELAKIGIIRKITMTDNKLEFANSRGLRKESREMFMRDMDNLLYMNDITRKLAEDLLMYSYYKEGLWFGPNNFGIFFSSNFISQFPEITDTLRNLKLNMNDERYERFLNQFYANNFKYPKQSTVLSKKVKTHMHDGKLFVEAKAVKDRRYTENANNPKYLKFVKRYIQSPFGVISEVYELAGVSDDFVMYELATRYDTSFGKVYNINTDYKDLVKLSELNITEQETPDTKSDKSVKDAKPVKDIKLVELNNTQDLPDNFGEDFIDPETYRDILLGNTGVTFEKYSPESGQKQLKKPLCKITKK